MLSTLIQIVVALYIIGIVVTWAIAGYQYGKDNQRSRNLAKVHPGTNPHGMQANPYMIAIVGLTWPAYYGIMKGQQDIEDELEAKNEEIAAKRKSLATQKPLASALPQRGSAVQPPIHREGKPQ